MVAWLMVSLVQSDRGYAHLKDTSVQWSDRATAAPALSVPEVRDGSAISN